MSATVSILDVEYRDGGETDVTVTVSTDQNDTVDYNLVVSDDSGGLFGGNSETINGTLFGGSGSFPGDSETHTITFDVGDDESGTVDAEVNPVGGGSVVTWDSDSYDWTADGADSGNGGGGGSTPDASVEIQVLGVDYDDAQETLTVTTTISTSDAAVVPYTYRVENSTGGQISHSGELAGGSGSFPGDTDTHETIFNISGDTTGTVTATTTDGPDATTTADWEVEPPDNGNGGSPSFDPGLIGVSCDAEQTIGLSDVSTFDVWISNDNDATAAYTADVLVNGNEIETLSGTVSGGGQVSESVSIEFDAPGTYNVDVDVSAQEA